MEDASKLRLQWHDHGTELSRLSREIFGNDDLADVTLTCRGGTPFFAHKIILAAASTYFRNFFREVRGRINQHPVIFLKDVDASEMEYLLQFIYRGEVDIPSEELERLIEIAKDLAIIGLDTVNGDGEKSERRSAKAGKRKTTSSPAASTSKQPKVKREYDDPLGDEDFDDFLGDEGGANDDEDDDTKADPDFEGVESGAKQLNKIRELTVKTPTPEARTSLYEDTKETAEPAIKKEKIVLMPNRRKRKTTGEYVERENMTVPIQEVLLTDRDAPLLVVNGFTYHNQNAGNVKVTWRCTIKGCKAYVATYRDWELSMVAAERGAHLHLPDPLALERARFVKRLKDKWAEVSRDDNFEDRAKATEMNTFARNLLKSIPEELNGCIPDEKCVIRMIGRWKQKQRERDGVPKPEGKPVTIKAINENDQTLPTRKYERKEKRKKVYARASCPNCHERFGILKLAEHFQECRATRPNQNLADEEEDIAAAGQSHSIFSHGRDPSARY